MQEFWDEAQRMAIAGLWVAAAALLLGIVARLVRPRGETLLPRWKPWRVPWGGVEVILAFLLVAVILPALFSGLLERSGWQQRVAIDAELTTNEHPDMDPVQFELANTIRMLWANALTLPTAFLILWLVRMPLYPKWKPTLAGQGSWAGKVWLAVVAWFVLAPAVLIFNAIVNAIFTALGMPPEQHVLTYLGNQPRREQALFAFEACVGAPLREELLFRGILLAWCVGRTKIPGAGVSPLTAARPWFVMVAAVVFASMFGHQRLGPVIFALLLAVGLTVVWRYQTVGARRARAVYATAAFFAVVHSSVWPNPIPLFVLGLGLGWLAVRTNGIFVPVLVHSLFNAVSVVFVLRGG